MPTTSRLRDSSAGAQGPALSVDAARLRALVATAPIARTETLPLDDALGRALAEAPLARSPVPPFDNSAMDGFALHTSSLSGSGPWRLPVVDRVAAGDRRLLGLPPGAAMRILTGAPVPHAADAVVMQERVIVESDRILLTERPAPGLNIRRRGEDQPADEGAVPVGHLLTPPRLALLAAAGVSEVTVRARLRVALFSTGNELSEPGTTLGPGQIYNSNRVM